MLTQAMEQTGTAQAYPTVGRWAVTFVPDGWQFVPDFGIRQMREFGYITANISLVEDALPEGKTLVEYIGKQCEMIQANHKEVKLAGPQASPFPNTEEGHMLLVRHRVKDQHDMLHVQNYVRIGSWIGIITLTALEAELQAVRPYHDAFTKGLYILPPQSETAA
jgi:hypothetical protein